MTRAPVPDRSRDGEFAVLVSCDICGAHDRLVDLLEKGGECVRGEWDRRHAAVHRVELDGYRIPPSGLDLQREIQDLEAAQRHAEEQAAEWALRSPRVARENTVVAAAKAKEAAWKREMLAYLVAGSPGLLRDLNTELKAARAELEQAKAGRVIRMPIIPPYRTLIFPPFITEAQSARRGSCRNRRVRLA